MIKYLIVKNLRAPRITASNHVVVGVPGPGAFYGLGYNIVRTLNELEARDRPDNADHAQLTRFAAAVGAFSFVNARKKYVPIHGEDKRDEPMGMVDECLGDITFSLVLELSFQGDGDLPDLSRLHTLIETQRFCGSYIDASNAKLHIADTTAAALQRLRGRNFMLRDLSMEVQQLLLAGVTLPEVYRQLLARPILNDADVPDGEEEAGLPATDSTDDPKTASEEDTDLGVHEVRVGGNALGPMEVGGLTSNAGERESETQLPDDFDDLFETLIAEPLETKQSSLETDASVEYAATDYRGHILPTLIGYRLLEAPRERPGARRGYLHAFAEPLIGLLRAQLVGSVLAARDREGEMPPVFFKPRSIEEQLLVYSALSDADFDKLSAQLTN